MITLDVIMRYIIFCVELSFSKMLLLEGQNGQTCKDHMHYIAHYVIFLMWMAKLTHPYMLPLPIFDVCCTQNLQGH